MEGMTMRRLTRLLARIAVPALVVGSSLAAVAPAAHADATTVSTEYAALAWSSPNGTAVVGSGDSAQAAIEDANSNCYDANHNTNCRSYVWVRHGYASLMIDAQGHWSAWEADSRQAADDGAKLKCSSGCHFVAQVQTADPGMNDGGLPGRVCFFIAGDNVYGLGHMGWAYRTGMDGLPDEAWTVGSTENVDGTDKGPKVEAGTNNYTWTGDGLTSHAALNVFTTGEPQNITHGWAKAGEYTGYACQDTAEINLAAAQQAVDNSKNGFTSVTDNCLTKAVAILTAYGAPLSELPGQWTPPNVYLNDLVWSGGFLPKHPIESTLGGVDLGNPDLSVS